jgi:putative transposase
MPNHVHLIAVPQREDSLAQAIGEAHRRYTTFVNLRENWRGHLWQGRFASYVMDERHALACIRYIEMNPVRAGLSDTPIQWRWSSAGAHMHNRNDALVKATPLRELVDMNWDEFLHTIPPADEADVLRRHERTGRPLGDPSFVDGIEERLGRKLRQGKRGRKSGPPYEHT